MVHMRNLLMLSAAASVLALGVSTQQAAAIFPGATAGFETFVQKVQQKSEEKGSGGAQGAQGGAQGKDTGARTGNGQARGAAQSQGDRGGQATRAGEERARSGQRRSTDVDVNVNRGRHGYRSDRRTRVGVDVDRRRGYRGGDVGVRRSYGYTAENCQEILRRYRQCVAR
jgi:hypothetical protein